MSRQVSGVLTRGYVTQSIVLFLTAGKFFKVEGISQHIKRGSIIFFLLFELVILARNLKDGSRKSLSSALLIIFICVCFFLPT